MSRDAIRDLTDDEARRALPLKWGAVPTGTVPAWVAEMDFALAPAVADAVSDAVRAGTVGYAPLGEAGVGAALAGFAGRHWDQDLPPDATYLVWLDLRSYGVDDPAAEGLVHGVKVAPGSDYQPGLAGHVRLNVATTPERTTLAVQRLAAAVG